MKGRIFIRGSTLLGISPALTYHFAQKRPSSSLIYPYTCRILSENQERLLLFLNANI